MLDHTSMHVHDFLGSVTVHTEGPPQVGQEKMVPIFRNAVGPGSIKRPGQPAAHSCCVMTLKPPMHHEAETCPPLTLKPPLETLHERDETHTLHSHASVQDH